MILFVVVTLLLPLSTAESFRDHLSDALRLKCDALPYRTAFLNDRCYAAVMKEMKISEASAECSSIFAGAKVSTDVPSSVFEAMMIDKSNFLTGSSSSGSKQIICSYDHGYKCDASEKMLSNGRCVVRAPKKMTLAAAKKYCENLGMELPGPDNDYDNKIVRDALAKDPAWVDKSFVQGNGFKWKQGTAYSRWSTCNYTAGHQPRLYSGSQNKLWYCGKDMASVVDRHGYWSNGETEYLMDVICIKNAENPFRKGASPCNYHESIVEELPQPTGEACGVLSANKCYTSVRTTARYEVLGKATVETQRGCEVLCNSKTECTAFSLKRDGTTSSCLLLSSKSSEVFSAPATIFLKKTSGCPARTNLTAEFGEDPCIDEIVPSAFRGFDKWAICDINRARLYVIRAVDECGRRITLDNEKHNYIVPAGGMWEWRYVEGKWSSTRRVVAAACVLAGAEKCPCEPIIHLTNIPDKPNYPATPVRVGPCNGPASWLWGDVAKAPGYVSYVSQWDTARADISCHAGLWIQFIQSSYNSWGITSLACYK